MKRGFFPLSPIFPEEQFEERRRREAEEEAEMEDMVRAIMGEKVRRYMLKQTYKPFVNPPPGVFLYSVPEEF